MGKNKRKATLQEVALRNSITAKIKDEGKRGADGKVKNSVLSKNNASVIIGFMQNVMADRAKMPEEIDKYMDLNFWSMI